MKTRLTVSDASIPADFPDADALAALRAWYAGLSSRAAIVRYLPGRTGQGGSARGVLGQIRQALIGAARQVHRDDLAALLAHPAAGRGQYAKTVAQAIEVLRHARPPEPQIADPV